MLVLLMTILHGNHESAHPCQHEAASYDMAGIDTMSVSMSLSINGALCQMGRLCDGGIIVYLLPCGTSLAAGHHLLQQTEAHP